MHQKTRLTKTDLNTGKHEHKKHENLFNQIFNLFFSKAWLAKPSLHLTVGSDWALLDLEELGEKSLMIEPE